MKIPYERQCKSKDKSKVESSSIIKPWNLSKTLSYNSRFVLIQLARGLLLHSKYQTTTNTFLSLGKGTNVHVLFLTKAPYLDYIDAFQSSLINVFLIEDGSRTNKSTET